MQEAEVAEDTVQLGLLTSGTAWSIGLSSRDSSTKQLINAACDLWGGSDSYPSLIYRYLVFFTSSPTTCAYLLILQHAEHSLKVEEMEGFKVCRKAVEEWKPLLLLEMEAPRSGCGK